MLPPRYCADSRLLRSGYPSLHELYDDYSNEAYPHESEKLSPVADSYGLVSLDQSHCESTLSLLRQKIDIVDSMNLSDAFKRENDRQ